jgi:predicted dehydrogenase
MKYFKDYKLAVVGLGYWGNNILSTLNKLNLKNINVYDPNKNSLASAKVRFKNIRLYASLEDLLSSKKLEAVIICSPVNTHYSIANKILDLDKHIFVEKPVTLESYKVKKLVNKAKNKKKIFMSGYVYHYNVYINYIEKILSKKVLGDIRFISFERLNLGPIRNDTSCLWDLGAHDLSILIKFFGKKILIKKFSKENVLKSKYYDICNVKIKIKNNIDVEIKSSWLHPEKVRRIVIIGKKKMLLFDEMNRKKPVKIYNKYANYPDISTRKKNFFSPRANIHIGKTIVPKIKLSSPLANEMVHFLNCILNNRQPLTDGNHAFLVSKLLERIEKNS